MLWISGNSFSIDGFGPDFSPNAQESNASRA
jgi:hypothetical protein